MKNIISQMTMKELEKIIHRSLQKNFPEAMATIVREMIISVVHDLAIARVVSSVAYRQTSECSDKTIRLPYDRMRAFVSKYSI